MSRITSTAPIPAGAGLNRPWPPRYPAQNPDPRRRGAQPRQVLPRFVPPNRSPQARGSTGRRARGQAPHAPIPAGAGLNRPSGGQCLHPAPDPRRRGAQPPRSRARSRSRSRSPQARGSTSSASAPISATGPIPAGAGLNQPAYRPDLGRGPDPRRRGAQPETNPELLEQLTPIPAGAGLNRCPATWARRCGSDPRRRGAQPEPLARRSAFSTRSPQARGSTAPLNGASCASPPIPAGAGLNRAGARAAEPRPADPRRRGAQPRAIDAPELIGDRSPQARGSTDMTEKRSPKKAPIPAGAGLNRATCGSTSASATDPRRRGAQPARPKSSARPVARSPQARGSTAFGNL